MIAKGGLVYFSYSGGLVCDPGLLGVQTVCREGVTFDFLSPIRLGDGGWRPIPRFTPSAFRKEFPTITPILDLYGFASHPAIKDDGTPAIISANEHAETSQLPRDTLPVMIDDPEWEKHAVTAGRLIAEALGLVRIKTLQWWAGRASESLTGNRHIGFSITNDHIDSHTFGISCRQTRSFEGTARLSPKLWQEIWDDIRASRKADNYRLLLSDAVYFYIIGEYRLSLVTLSSAIESARDVMSDRLKLSFKGPNLPAHLSNHLETKIGRNLKTERLKDFEFLKSVWIARGHLAHGKEMFWQESEIFGSTPAEHFFQPAYDIIEWIAELGVISKQGT